MHYLPFPRRRYRELFFPPGLLALAGLLWLGCVTVVDIKKSTTQYSVVENAQIKSIDWCQQPMDKSQPIIPPCLPSAVLAQFRQWYSFSLIGNTLPDYFTLQHIQIIVQQFQQEPNLDRGMQVHFAAGANYANLVHLLDLLDQAKAQKHWLDLSHEPAMLYCITEKPKPIDPNQPLATDNFICGTKSGIVILNTPTHQVALLDRLQEQLRFFRRLLFSEWRNTALIWLLITALSTWKLRQQWRTAS
ncbi:hypothetical protein [Hymenobacter metallilatus]|uniref:Uncharacterized protein n=1 Tax=Hymenobacter metallilatus TaxID=2493666 RepID=A0A3R9NPR9_9BACT|nr:hypothetical protein [Hymenobacter metallilatus]RSK33909.1 hypothetical protein EI290_09395 [Hymenobacter metallilatus]